MPRFVILEHDWPFDHFDLMLEAEGVLLAWRLPTFPELGNTLSAESLPDHRIEYLEYEGPLTRGRGRVKRWDRGEYASPSSGVSNSATRLTFNLYGERITASVVWETGPEGGGTMRFLPILEA